MVIYLKEVPMQLDAKTIIEKLGGIKKTSEILGVSETQVYRFTYSKGVNNGSGNTIPPKHWNNILAHAKSNNIDIDTTGLFKMFHNG
jgi:hypothetical protein